MSVFSRPLPPYRIAQTEHGDTIQSISARELGDANRWPELVWLNDLAWPFITDDESRAGPSVLLSGSLIKIPSPVGVSTRDDDPNRVFERDVRMVGRQMRATEGGDFEVVAGASNLAQQLNHRIATPKGQLMRHPEYGSTLYRILGRVSGPAANILAKDYTQAALLSDYRVRSIEALQATTDGDAVRVNARVETIAGGVVDVVTE